MSIEKGVSAPQNEEDECPARSPGGWVCCLPKDHDGNHVGTTGDFVTLYQWADVPIGVPVPAVPGLHSLRSGHR